MSLSKPVKSLRVNTLKEGQKFRRVITGAPCLTEYKYLHSIGGMTKASRVKDNYPVLFKDYLLVYPSFKY